MGDRRIKVAVLGGGCGAMAAAFELTKTAELRERYEVTVYQQGWRLGGKGASGRNAAYADRIEEHGLHAFLGFYENAFSVMRAVYAEWEKKPDNPFQSWTDAFKPQRQVSLAEWVPEGSRRSEGDEGRWAAWNVTPPRLPGEPGDGGIGPSLAEMLARLLRLLDAHVAHAHEEHTGTVPVSRPARSDAFAAIIARARETLDGLGHRLEALCHPALEEAHLIVQAIVRASPLSVENEPAVLVQLIAEARDSVRALSRSIASSAKSLDDDWRRLHLVVELGSAIALGIVSDVLPRPGEARGFESINSYDFKEWLEWHGAAPDVAWSAPTRALYDLGFAYEGGKADREHARAAAGVALGILLRLTFGYKDAPLWKMQAGMGDTIFAPLYEVLAKRGVRFELFHRVLALEPSPNGNAIAQIVIARQVSLVRPYEPLVTVKGLPCWPSEPRWEQIDGGDEMKKNAERHDFESAWCRDQVGAVTLEYGRDFDHVVLGIALGALPDVAPKLRAASARWEAMLARTKTVATQALQLWLTPDLEGLGWKSGTTILTGYVEPFDTWGEMSHLLPREDWKARPGTGRFRSRSSTSAARWRTRCRAHPCARDFPKRSIPPFPCGPTLQVRKTRRHGSTPIRARCGRARVDPPTRPRPGSTGANWSIRKGARARSASMRSSGGSTSIPPSATCSPFPGASRRVWRPVTRTS